MEESSHSETKYILPLVTAAVFLIYFLLSPPIMAHFDYTFRIADALLHGRLGMAETPPSWLNEMVPFGDRYYSVFPLGSVLCLIPFASLKSAHVLGSFPAGFVAALMAATSAGFFFLLSGKYGDSISRRIVLALFPVLGTWTWCNLAFAGAWQLALGFAVLGQAGALYFTLIKRSPWLAGILFAIAFGNRTEVMLTAPIFIYFLSRGIDDPQLALFPEARASGLRAALARFSDERRAIAQFLTVPVALGVATLIYNYARFYSVLDFGYIRIPAIQNEDWFKNGLFSVYAIPANAEAMLWDGWKMVAHRPYLIPKGFGGSILASSPFLFLLLRKGVRDRSMIVAGWLAILVLTLFLWLHANPGGWQFAYRYGMILIPWMFLILLDTGRKRVSRFEVILFTASVAINAYATYMFTWTNRIQP